MLLAIPSFNLHALHHELNALNSSSLLDNDLKNQFEKVLDLARMLLAYRQKRTPKRTREFTETRLCLNAMHLSAMATYIQSTQGFPHQRKLCERLIDMSVQLIAMAKMTLKGRVVLYLEGHQTIRDFVISDDMLALAAG